jgi:Protein of unknown function (DUF742)
MDGPRRVNDPQGLQRYYVLTNGRSEPGPEAAALDVATLIVSRSGPVPGKQHEHESIVRVCGAPMAMAELSSHLRLPFSILAVLVGDLLAEGRVEARHPVSVWSGHDIDRRILEEVLIGLQGL